MALHHSAPAAFHTHSSFSVSEEGLCCRHKKLDSYKEKKLAFSNSLSNTDFAAVLLELLTGKAEGEDFSLLYLLCRVFFKIKVTAR